MTTRDEFRTGHPRSFGCMRLAKTPLTPPGVVEYETPDGVRVFWSQQCKSPVLCRQIIGGKTVWTPYMGAIEI